MQNSSMRSSGNGRWPEGGGVRDRVVPPFPAYSRLFPHKIFLPQGKMHQATRGKKGKALLRDDAMEGRELNSKDGGMEKRSRGCSDLVRFCSAPHIRDECRNVECLEPDNDLALTPALLPQGEGGRCERIVTFNHAVAVGHAGVWRSREESRGVARSEMKRDGRFSGSKDRAESAPSRLTFQARITSLREGTENVEIFAGLGSVGPCSSQ